MVNKNYIYLFEKKKKSKKGGTGGYIDLQQLEPGINLKIFNDPIFKKHLKILNIIKILDNPKLTNKILDIYKNNREQFYYDFSTASTQEFFSYTSYEEIPITGAASHDESSLRKLAAKKLSTDEPNKFNEFIELLSRDSKRAFVLHMGIKRQKNLLTYITKKQKNGELPLWPKRIKRNKSEYETTGAIPLIHDAVMEYEGAKNGSNWWNEFKIWWNEYNAHIKLGFTSKSTIESEMILEIYKDYIFDYLNAFIIEAKETTPYKRAEYMLEYFPFILYYNEDYSLLTSIKKLTKDTKKLSKSSTRSKSSTTRSKSPTSR